MDIQFKTILTTAICTLALGGCGGSSVSDGSGSSAGASGGTTPPASGTTTADGVSYLPLSVYEAYKEFSGFTLDGVFQGETRIPYINTYVINPVDSSNLESITTAVASDYKLTIDGIDIDPLESFPVLQKVIGSETYLQTALVFDVSGSVTGVNIQALVDEAKNYITVAQASSNEAIKNQEFVVWAFGSQIQELTNDFTSNTATINAALDQVVTIYNAGTLGSSSNLHKAILQAVGRYIDTVTPYDFSADGDNDLFDRVVSSGTFLSQLVIFSSGPDTFLEIDKELMTKAIESQSFVKYTGASTSDTFYLNKPVFYYVTGGSNPGVTYQTLADLSEDVTSLTLSGGSYSFASTLVVDQIAAINARVDLNNQYIYRYAFPPRFSDHTIIFDSSSSDYSYALTTEIDGLLLNSSLGTPEDELSSLVEITGPNGEFVSGSYVGGNVYVGTINLSEQNTFAPVTRWVNQIYDPVSDYSWSISGGSGTVNANGTYTVNSISGATATLTLTNTLRGETAQIVIANQ